MDKKPLMRRKSMVVCIILLFVGASFIPVIAQVTEKSQLISRGNWWYVDWNKSFPQPCRGETELKYYIVANVHQVVACDTGGHSWKTAIRLTQDEMAPYRNWTMTKVIIVALLGGFYPDGVDIRIYLYEQGTTPIWPGYIIANDTTAHLNVTGVTTIPLNTTVDLANYEEIWVAVEWPSLENLSSFAWMDTITGPHVENKSDFVDLGSWQQLHDILPGCDGRWGIGAIVEGTNLTELSIGDLKGPMGIKANISNIGPTNASNVEWSLRVTGGFLKKVDKSVNGTLATLAAGASTSIHLRTFIGFGKINILIKAKAQNALKQTSTKSAYLLGPFVVGIY